MCDEKTEAENESWINRRQLGLGVAAAGLVGLPARAAERATRQRAVRFETADGQADGFFVTPDTGKHPGVLLWPDVAGLRPAYEQMATRLAGAGYAVLALNPYYRQANSPVLKHFDEWRTDAGRARIAPMREALTPEAVARDAVACVAWLDRQPEVDASKRVGVQGYCMSGSFAFRAAAAAPERVGAFASFHGGGLVSDASDSPHALLAKVKAAALVCVAQNDHEREPDAKAALEKAAAAAGVKAEIEVYPANHGWCALDSPVYDATQAERAWARLLATYTAHLV